MCSLEDREILISIGYADEIGTPLSLKELTLELTGLNLMGLGSTTTIRRRLIRLINHGMVVKRIANHDGRVIHLMLSSKALRLFAGYGRMMMGMRWPRAQRLAR
ncbi:hypothetical protein [Denitratisoma oestradiolicum]|nr:hypothetical protein [Denitratisoma oestradiolicum]